MNAAIAPKSVSPSTVTRPTGGYRPVSTRQVCLLWSAYRSKLLPTFLDVRVYWALLEIAERRAAAGRAAKLKPTLSNSHQFDQETIIAEARRLVRTETAPRVRAAIRRMKELGIVRFDSRGIELPEGDALLSASLTAISERMASAIHDRLDVRCRSLPIPRRVLRFLAGCGRPSVTACMLGHMIRCLWWVDGRCVGVGSCSVAFITELFGIHERNVKRARSWLKDAGWLCDVPAPASHVNAFGARIDINLEWSPGFPAGVAEITKSPPPCAPRITKTPPPVHKHELLSGSENPSPPATRRVGVCTQGSRQFPPDLRHIEVHDLRDPARLNGLFVQAVRRKLVRGSLSDRLRFFAAAEHALRVGRQNPCGLFAAILRRGLWAYISQADEDRAAVKLKFAEQVEGSTDKTMPRLAVNGRGDDGEACPRAASNVTSLVRRVAQLRSVERALTPTPRGPRPGPELQGRVRDSGTIFVSKRDRST
jgi:hypothetical protein